MSRKLKCVVVDDDALAIEAIKDNCVESSYAEIVNSFISPKEFLKVSSKFDYDLAFIDIEMPGMNGFQVARQLNNKPIIFVTGVEDKLKEATDFCTLGVISKPITRLKLDNLLGIAHKVIMSNHTSKKESKYLLFHTTGSSGKVNVKLSDILYVKTHHTGRQNKLAILKGGINHIFVDCSFEVLLEASHNLIRINKSELISIEVFDKIDSDLITLKITAENGRPKQVNLNRWFKKDFITHLSHNR